MLPKVVALFVLCLQLGSSQKALFRCINLYSKDSCFALHNPLRKSLLRNERNHFELSQAFYPVGVFASTSLINVCYTVKFTASNESALPSPCPEINWNSSSIVATNGSATFSVGWSSSGVFNIISPIQLSELQLQLLNELYSFFIVPGSGIFLAGKFGWKVEDINGQPVNLNERNIVELSLHLDLSTLTCIPDTNLIKAVLQDITIFLKVYASTESKEPDISEDDLGFVTAAGIEVNDTEQIYFTPNIPRMFLVLNVFLGLCVLFVSSFFFIKTYKQFSAGRRQFVYYFTALAIVALLVNLSILVLDAIKSPQWCRTMHITAVNGIPKSGCDMTVITKLSYQMAAVLFSLIAAVVVFKYFEKQERKFQTSGYLRKIRYIMGFWMIILMLGLLTWGIVPSVLLYLVYPNVVISLSALIIAGLFWCTVVFSIPFLFVHNFMKSPDFLAAYQCFIRLSALAMALLIACQLTISYLTANVFGSATGRVLGIAFAVVPSIILTVFSEHYRDWFLTRVISDGGSSEENTENTKEKVINFFRTTILAKAASKRTTYNSSPPHLKDHDTSENKTAFDVQPDNDDHCSNEGNNEDIKLQVIATGSGVKVGSCEPNELDISEDPIVVVDGKTDKPNTNQPEALLSDPEDSMPLRRATVGDPTIPQAGTSTGTHDPVKLRRGGFQRNNEPRHVVIRRLTQAYNKK